MRVDGFGLQALGIVTALVAALITPMPQSSVASRPLTATAAAGAQLLIGEATASSSAGPDHQAARAVDRLPGTGWRSADTRTPQWLRVDLGSVHTLDRIDQVFAAEDTWRFRIDGSVDGADWATLVDESRGAAGRSFGRDVSGAYRFVRLTVLSSGSGRAASSDSFLLTGSAAGGNIAVGKTATASSALAKFEPGKAIDGNTSTYWAASGHTLPQWLEVDLGSPSVVTGVEQNFKDVDLHSFVIEGSVDKSAWVPLLDRRSGSRGQTFSQQAAGTYRYVRLTVTGSAAGYWAGSAEFAVDGFDNLARGKATSSDSAAAGYETGKAVDADPRTFWGAADNGFPHWLTVDLGGRSDLKRIEQSFMDHNTWRFRIDGSLNNSTWTTLVDRSAGAAGQHFAQDVSGQFRYVRLTVLGSAAGHWACSQELKVFGTPIVRNLAPGTSATSSSLGPGFEPFKAVDGNPSSYWGASSDAMPQWLMVDLGNASVVERVEQSFVDNDLWRFKLEGSRDKTVWQPLLDRTAGAQGRVFSQDVTGSYRYIRLTVTAPSGGRHWAASQELKVFGTGSPVTAKWWESRSAVMRFYPVWQQIRLDAITAQLDTLRSQGYRAIELTPVFQGVRDLWAGLAVTNLYAIHPDIGTMQDFEELLAAAHARDIKVIFFANPGYAHVSSPYFRKAEDDFRNGVNSVERSWFDIRPQPGEYPHLWHYSDRARGYYWGTWHKDAPSFNFSSQSWLDETRKYTKFWMDKGVDGIVFDAPNVYHTITLEKNNYAITDVLRNYDTFMNGEGLREPTYIYDWHYNSLQDYTITQWGEPPGQGSSAIVNAIESGNPGGLEGTLKSYRDLMVNAGGITQTPPNWGRPDYPVDKRLLEIATLTTMGTLFYLHNDYFTILPHETEIPNWPAEKRELIYKLQRAQNNSAALAPTGLRVKLPTNDDRRFYAYKRTSKDGAVKALVLLNFQNTAQTVSVDLTGTGIATSQTPVDLVSGGGGPAIGSANYQVTLPAYGFKILSVQ